MSDFIHVKGQNPINLDLVESIELPDEDKSIRFVLDQERVSFEYWRFDDPRKAKAVYLAILANKSKDIGEVELTEDEVRQADEA